MSVPKMGITLDRRELDRLMRIAPRRTKRAIVDILDASAKLTEKSMKQNVNKASRALEKDIKTKKGNLWRRVGSDLNYAVFLEEGTRPHFPPAYKGSSLDLWAESKGIPTYAVARSIARKGTKAHPFVEPTYIDVKPKIGLIAKVRTAKLAQELN